MSCRNANGHEDAKTFECLRKLHYGISQVLRYVIQHKTRCQLKNNPIYKVQV